MIRHLLLALALLAAPLSAAAQEQWVEGRHYQAVTDPQAPRDTDTIEVAEFFWYGCPACYALEPHLETWLETKAGDVVFTRYAASLAQAWRTHARAYYTAEALDAVDDVHRPLFDAIHEGRRAMNTPSALAGLFNEQAGIDEEAFQRAYDSFGVENRLRRGDQLARRYQITGVPSIVVNGKWLTGPAMAQSYERLIAIVDHLVELERGGAAPAGDRPQADADAGPAAAPPQPAEALETGDEPLDDGAVALWWLWLLALLVVAAFVVVGVRRSKR